VFCLLARRRHPFGPAGHRTESLRLNRRGQEKDEGEVKDIERFFFLNENSTLLSFYTHLKPIGSPMNQPGSFL